MQIINDIQQGTDEWHALRLGSIGGSSIQSVCAKGQGKSRQTLLYRFAGEILSGVKYEGYQNSHMERGIEQEAKARQAYEITTGSEVTQVGLVVASKRKHYSPDGLVNDDGIIEIKCVIPSVHVETIAHGKVPAAYRKQIQWGLHICEREWCDFVSYSPLVKAIPIFIFRVSRDEELIKEMDQEADRFLVDLGELIYEIMGQ